MPPGDGPKKKAGGAKGGVGKKKKDAGSVLEPNLKKRGMFSKDLRLMMYGYGDAEAPFSSTVDLVEDIIVDYATTMAHIAMDQATGRGGKLQPEDFLYLVRKDPKKFARATELLRMNEEIKQAKKVFNPEDSAEYEEG